MSPRDAFALALKEVIRRLGRSVLTLMAVSLAACLLTALVLISRTAETEVLRQLAKGGPLASIKVAAAAPDPSQLANDNARPGAPRDLGPQAAREIGQLSDVASVVPVITSRMIFVPSTGAPGAGRLQPSYFFDTAVGADLRDPSLLPISVLAGRLPAPGSLTEVAVTPGYLERLRLDPTEPEKVLGAELEMGPPRVFNDLEEQTFRALWQRTEIVGVVAQEAAPGGIVTSIEHTRRAQRWSAASDGDTGELELSNSPYTGLVVVADGLDRIGKVRRQITDIGYSTSAPENLIASVQRYLNVVEIVLTAIGSIALVIACLGIANALLAAVRERRREIGVLKAIGARDRDILFVFLIEASLLGALGGVLGSLGGWAAASAVGIVVNSYLTAQGLLGVHLGPSWRVLLLGVLGSTLLASVAGAVPALKAARLPAREAVSEA